MSGASVRQAPPASQGGLGVGPARLTRGNRGTGNLMSSSPCESAAEVPLVRLDPMAADHHGEAARMRALGPLVRAILPGEVTVWVVTEHALLAELLTDARISKNWRNWSAVQREEISDDWPLIGMVKVTNMVTSDGSDHQRLRRPVTRTFTRGRVEAMRPRITEIVRSLLDNLPSQAGANGVVDLRQHYAYPIPCR